jgi:hypothetical protein
MRPLSAGHDVHFAEPPDPPPFERSLFGSQSARRRLRAKDVGTDPGRDDTGRYLSWLSLLALRLNKVFIGRLSRAD